MDPTKVLLLVQFLVLVVLVGVVAFFLVVDRKHKPSPQALDELNDLLRQTRELSVDFQEQIQTKGELITRLMTELDDRLREARLVKEGVEKTTLCARQPGDFTRADVEKLATGGYEPAEISRITGIPIGEVQLIIRMNHEQG